MVAEREGVNEALLLVVGVKDGVRVGLGSGGS